jgi:hypothetical protein
MEGMVLTNGSSLTNRPVQLFIGRCLRANPNGSLLRLRALCGGCLVRFVVALHFKVSQVEKEACFLHRYLQRAVLGGIGIPNLGSEPVTAS